MIERLNFGDKLVDIKVSAGTGILYRMAFNKDITKEVMSFGKAQKSIKGLDFNNISDFTETDYETINDLTHTVDNLAMELLFIMNAEATLSIDEIFNYVSDKQNYFKFLLGLDSEAMNEHKNKIINFYVSSMKGQSKSKN